MALDFSDALKDLEDDWDDVVSTSIMLRAERDALNIDWDAIPADQLILGTELLHVLGILLLDWKNSSRHESDDIIKVYTTY